MAPAFSESGEQNASLTIGSRESGREAHGGRVLTPRLDSRLPNKAMRAPDVSWISQARYDRIPKREMKRFAKICPDFVLELRSTSDRLPSCKRRWPSTSTTARELGWLIDPLKKQVFVYRPGQQVEHLLNPATLSGEPVLAGFTLDLARVW